MERRYQATDRQDDQAKAERTALTAPRHRLPRVLQGVSIVSACVIGHDSLRSDNEDFSRRTGDAAVLAERRLVD
jgi:hypothetical protein